jgi:hypothetical protein
VCRDMAVHGSAQFVLGPYVGSTLAALVHTRLFALHPVAPVDTRMARGGADAEEVPAESGAGRPVEQLRD